MRAEGGALGMGSEAFEGTLSPGGASVVFLKGSLGLLCAEQTDEGGWGQGVRLGGMMGELEGAPPGLLRREPSVISPHPVWCRPSYIV